MFFFWSRKVIKDDYICMNIFDYEIINGEIIPNEPRIVKISINDILVSNGFEPIKKTITFKIININQDFF